MSAMIARLARIEGAAKNLEARSQRKKPRRALINLTRADLIVGGTGLTIVIPLGGRRWIAGMADQIADNAYLRADTTPISARSRDWPGRIRPTLAEDLQGE
jgi:membrane fusion protein (multidrug efflux system)